MPSQLGTLSGNGERPIPEIMVIGLGYVGLTTAVCLASAGNNHVLGIDHDPDKISALRRGDPTFYEPDLGKILSEALEEGALAVTTDPAAGAATADFVFLCLPTPQTAEGAVDTSVLWASLRSVEPQLRSGCIVVIKSTVPVGTTDEISEYLAARGVSVAANPEFLREGHSVQDFLHPFRIVIGAERHETAEAVGALYDHLSSPIHVTSSASAELAKYSANAFLALRLSYANLIAELSERSGANAQDVLDVIGADPRIGSEYLRPGPGWGGPCLPKDTSELLRFAGAVNAEDAVLRATIRTNQHQIRRIGSALTDLLGTLRGNRISLFGLAFKTGTSDLRGSPAISIARLLIAEGAEVLAYDPMVTMDPDVAGMAVLDDPYQAVDSADAVLIMTDWPEFNDLNWTCIASRMDGVHVLDSPAGIKPALLRRAGLRHVINWRMNVFR